MRLFTLMLSFLLITGLHGSGQETKDYTQYVNPFIGTGSVDSLSLSGSNFPGAAYPFGLVQLSPDTDDNPEDPCSGYDYADSLIMGFSHTHLSGTGVADLFDFLFMPTQGTIKWNARDNKNSAGYSAHFSHANEKAIPSYYSVLLDDENILAELTATEHCGMHRYTFNNAGTRHLMIDLDHSLDKQRPYWRCKIIGAQIRIVNDHTLEGYRIITGWARLRKVYFRAEFSQPFTSHTIKAGNTITQNQPIANHPHLKTALSWETSHDPLIVRVGISSVSQQGATNNLHTEITHFNFDDVAQNTRHAWNNELKIIDIEGSQQQKTIFYTSLYHTLFHPNNIADADSSYLNSDLERCKAADGKHYSTFSLWDTYRAAHPLYTLTQPERTASFINSMLRQYQDYGYLPIWQLWGSETYCMIGNHAIPVIADALTKNIPCINKSLAWDAIKASSTNPHQNNPFTLLDQYHFIPEDKNTQSVSIALEVAYNDWCAAMVAHQLGHDSDYQYFLSRSSYYKNLFHQPTGFFRAKDHTGQWIEPFSPLKYGGNGGYPFTEGNGWQYLWYVPHDIYTFIDMLGGEKTFNQKLDTFFTLTAAPGDVNGNASGFIGQYAHGNEPSHHIAYLYNYSGQPWKTQQYAAQIMQEQYTTTPSGYSGNEDCGQMSAWYIFSSMGFYPVNPANSIYCFGSPQLQQATLHLPHDKEFNIITHNSGHDNIYIGKIKLNGKPYRKTYITHQDITQGGTLEFFMQSHPRHDMAKYEKPPLNL